MLVSEVLKEALWADTRPAGEDPLQVEFAGAHVAGDVGETGLLASVLLDVADGLLDIHVVRGGGLGSGGGCLGGAGSEGGGDGGCGAHDGFAR